MSELARTSERKNRQRKCKCCRRWFMPQPQNAWHQHYCTRPGCRRASHRESQRKYDLKHPDRYKGDSEVLRVQLWREAHPRYWHRCRHRQLLVVEIRWDEDSPGCRVRIVRERWAGGALRDLYQSQLALPRRVVLPPDRALPNSRGLFATFCHADTVDRRFRRPARGKRAQNNGRKT